MEPLHRRDLSYPGILRTSPGSPAAHLRRKPGEAANRRTGEQWGFWSTLASLHVCVVDAGLSHRHQPERHPPTEATATAWKLIVNLEADNTGPGITSSAATAGQPTLGAARFAAWFSNCPRLALGSVRSPSVSAKPASHPTTNRNGRMGSIIMARRERAGWPRSVIPRWCHGIRDLCREMQSASPHYTPRSPPQTSEPKREGQSARHTVLQPSHGGGSSRNTRPGQVTWPSASPPWPLPWRRLYRTQCV